MKKTLLTVLTAVLLNGITFPLKEFKKTAYLLFFLLLSIVYCTATFANNISVSNASIATSDITNHYSMVQFDISWENSWRTSSAPINWDAAWVFMKYRIGSADITLSGSSSSGTTITSTSTTGLRVGMPLRVASGTGVFATGTVITSITNSTTFVVNTAPTTVLSGATITAQRFWEHATINSTGHTVPSGSTITPSSDGKGIFMYRSADGTGTFSNTGIQLRWNYGTDNVVDNSLAEVKVFAIEMVYVPQGAFKLGSGGSGSTSEFYSNTTTTPYTVSGEGAITVAATVGNLYYNNGASAGDRTGPIPDAFPKGYNAFYCMKYEICQQQYVNFLNTLSRAQQTNRVVSAITEGTTSVGSIYVMVGAAAIAYRNGIRCSTTIPAFTPVTFFCDYSGNGIGGESNDGQNIACSNTSWMDIAAYLDWSALRPMTELEFEKSCRGTANAVANEFAWGTTNTSLAMINTTTTSNPGSANEVPGTASNCSGWLGMSVLNMPMRGGCFATSSTTREQSGATYYGIMEMSGNLYERPVSAGNVAGRSFTGVHGNGLLNSTGWADVDYWPGINGNATVATANSTYGGTTGVTNCAGNGWRGGSWGESTSIAFRISDRIYAALTSSIRSRATGGRGVRTAP